jgi:hypothetical protein
MTKTIWASLIAAKSLRSQRIPGGRSSVSIHGRNPALSDGRGHAPLDHPDLHGVVHNQARDHGLGENCERLRPRQWDKSLKTYARQDGACERIRNQGGREGLARHRRRAALTSGHHGKVKQHKEAKGLKGGGVFFDR